MSNSNIAGYDISIDPFAPNLLHEQTPEGAVGITASASVDNTTGNPNVVVARTKVGDNYNFDFAFTGLVGEKGNKGDKGDRGETGQRGLQGTQGLPGPRGETGETGETGVGIANITFLDYDNNGNAIYRITLSNASTYDFIAYKGPQGEQGPQGLPGDGADGVGISNIEYTSTDANGNNIYTVTLSNGQTYNFTANRGPQGLPGANGANGTNGQDGQTPVVSATATVDNTIGTPAVSVTTGGTTLAPIINFDFTGLKGEKGDAGGSSGTLVYEDNVLLSYSADSSSNSSVCSSTEQITNKTGLIMKTINIAAADLADLTSGDSIRVALTLLSGNNALGYRNAYLGKSGGSSTGSNVTCVSQYEVNLYGMGDKHRIQETRLPIIDNSGVPIPPINYCYAYAPVYAEQCARYQGSGLSIDFIIGFDLNNIAYDNSITFYNDDVFVATDLTYKVEVYKL